MDTQIVPSSSPAPRAPTHTPIRGTSFDEVHEIVATRAARMLPDTVAHVADLVFTAEGHVVVPNEVRFAMESGAGSLLAA